MPNLVRHCHSATLDALTLLCRDHLMWEAQWTTNVSSFYGRLLQGVSRVVLQSEDRRFDPRLR